MTKQLPKENEFAFPNEFGGFDVRNREYVINHGGQKVTPRPWGNVLANPYFGTIVTESSFGSTWFDNSKDKRITIWSNDTVIDSPSEVIYVKDKKTEKFWSVTRKPCVSGYKNTAMYTTRHGMGYSVYESLVNEIQQVATVVVDKDDAIKAISLKLKNLSSESRDLELYYYLDVVMGNYKNQFDSYVHCSFDESTQCAKIIRSDKSEYTKFAFVSVSEKVTDYTFNKNDFIGYTNTLASPRGVTHGIEAKSPRDNCCVLQSSVTLEAGEQKEVLFLLGAAANDEEMVRLRHSMLSTTFESVLERVKHFWHSLSNQVSIETPDPAIDLIFNQWTLYQTLSCRIWGRSSFYQSSGAYGFRDQLQDSMAMVYANPALCKEHILRAAARQFEEGDVQHWWFGDSSLGVRNKVADSPIWLAYVTDFYIEKTGDESILQEEIPYLKGKLLDEQLNAYVEVPIVSELKEPLWNHCIKAIEKVCDFGMHGIPLIKEGDWNDGMNLVGELGKGESVWLGWFLGAILQKFIDRAKQRGEIDIATKFQNTYDNLKVSMHNSAWDDAWYLRGYTDQGHKIGTSTEMDCMIDSISQSWAVLSGMDDEVRQKQALQSATTYLVDQENELAMLLYPAFDKGAINPGYIKDYVPGIRENGGQYSHAAFWLVMAFAKHKDGEMAHKILSYTNPIYRSRNPHRAKRYELEPYVIGGDIYSSNQHMSKGGWSWYTGSAGWYFRTVLESIIGFKLHGNKATFTPCVPSDWRSFSLKYRYGKSAYTIKFTLGEGHKNTVQKVNLDWHDIEGDTIELVDDGKEHQVLVLVV